MQLAEAYAVKIKKLMEYEDSKEDPLIETVRTYKHNINCAVLQRDGRFRTELQRVTRQLKDCIAAKTREKWRVKRMEVQFPRYLEEKLVDNEQSYRWLKFGDSEGETESTTVAAEDQAICTDSLKRKF
jgi:hypothetical protein